MSHTAGKPSPSKQKPIPAYFPHPERKDGWTTKGKGDSKMADATGGAWAEAETLTKTDIMEVANRITGLETDLLQKLTDLIKPLSDQLIQLNLSLQNVSKVAEGAMDLSLTQQEDIRGLQQESETQAERLAILTNRQRFFNLKFRGIKENAEENGDLIIYMATWLARVVNAEDRCAPDISQAYRVGNPNNPKRLLPRDVIVTFKDIRVKNTILTLAREHGYLPHLNEKDQVYADLAPEALEKKKELKDIMIALREAKIKHRWASPLKLQIIHNGRPYYVRSVSDGHDILQMLGIQTPMALEKTSFKRKLDETPQALEKAPKFHKNFSH